MCQPGQGPCSRTTPTPDGRALRRPRPPPPNRAAGRVFSSETEPRDDRRPRTHDLDEAFRIEERGAVVHEGRILSVAVPGELVLDPAIREVLPIGGRSRYFEHIRVGEMAEHIDGWPALDALGSAREGLAEFGRLLLGTPTRGRDREQRRRDDGLHRERGSGINCARGPLAVLLRSGARGRPAGGLARARQ